MYMYNNNYKEQELFLIKKLFLTTLITNGKKLLAERLFFNLLVDLKSKYKQYKNFEIFYTAILILRPLLILKPIKIGVVKYKIPVPVSDAKCKLIAIKLIINSVRSSNGISIENLSNIMFSTFLGMKTVASEKKIALYREIINNKVFLKYIK